ncbi:hypothetical protein R3Q08_29905 [Rhodococcus erythropolis]|uniref:hypothetical protein n=1 Tax=Rhodococcus erythropolis TaxID=1833 RepID=UPI002948EA12|nr:hypothetical protein [Rhodococcus erythropolis]MDV6212482.1 hypothetical protein [Rhodococcus erythropolis]
MGRDQQQSAIRALYGKEVDEALEGIDPDGDRIKHLVSAYSQSLRDETALPYILRFDMLNMTGNVSYALLHATANKLGIKRMKQAMWKVDPGGSYQFSDRSHGEAVLFQPEPDLTLLRSLILNEFQNRRGITKDEVHWYTILETSYRETHATPLLANFEKEGLIDVRRPSGRRGFSDGVTFDLV